MNPHDATRSLARILAVAIATPVVMFGVASAAVSLPKVFADHMVLQRESPIRIWGNAAPDEAIRVQLADQAVGTVTDEDGKWLATLPAMPAGGPHTLTVKGENTVTLTDVLVGEVWVASGQSNMNMAIKGRRGGIKDWAAELEAANYDQLRLLQVPCSDPQDPTYNWQWVPCSPDTVKSFSAIAYFFARQLHAELKIPIGIINASKGGSPIQSWVPGGGLYQAGIQPLLGLGLRGVLWYQGETNVGMGMAYADEMKKLITGWRAAWDRGDFPFYYVQIAPCRAYSKPMVELARLWDAQRACLAIPGTAMIGTSDIGDLTDIHPKNKQEVGRRLALAALANIYGRDDVIGAGPLYHHMEREGDKIRIFFDHAGTGLASSDQDPICWLQIAGADQTFVFADAKIEGSSLLVWSAQVPEPQAVRLGWDGAAEHNLVNSAHLPALPFRTDDWPIPPPAPAARQEITMATLAGVGTLAEAREHLADQPSHHFSSGGRSFGSVRYAILGDELAVLAEIRDARITPETKQWPGTTLDLYAVANEDSPVRQIIITLKGAPAQGVVTGYELAKKLKEPPHCRWDVRPLPECGYSLCLLTPRSFFGIDNGLDGFLTEAAVVTTRHPDKKGTWMALFESLGAFRNKERYARVTLRPAAPVPTPEEQPQ